MCRSTQPWHPAGVSHAGEGSFPAKLHGFSVARRRQRPSALVASVRFDGTITRSPPLSAPELARITYSGLPYPLSGSPDGSLDQAVPP